MKCPTGYILRKGYYRKGYHRKDGTFVKGSYVEPACVKDQGKKGKAIFKRPLKKGELTQFGYHLKDTDQLHRRGSLFKAMKHFQEKEKDGGPLKVFRMINALQILNKNTNPTYSKRAENDKEWISRNYL